jgi:hypothetical protein
MRVERERKILCEWLSEAGMGKKDPSCGCFKLRENSNKCSSAGVVMQNGSREPFWAVYLSNRITPKWSELLFMVMPPGGEALQPCGLCDQSGRLSVTPDYTLCHPTERTLCLVFVLVQTVLRCRWTSGRHSRGAAIIHRSGCARLVWAAIACEVCDEC